MAATTELKKTHTFKLGRVVFSVKNCDEEFKNALETLLPPGPENCDAEKVYDEAQMESGVELRSLINHVLKRHEDCLWLDAACLVSPEGKIVLITGKSCKGKSTTSMALALGAGWRVVSEDITLIDLTTNEFVPFCSPYSLKAGTAELLKSAIGRSPEPILLGEFAPIGKAAITEPINAKVDFALHFGNPDRNLSITKIDKSGFVRRVLSCSNILRITDGANRFQAILDNSECAVFEGGTLPERLQAIDSLLHQERTGK